METGFNTSNENLMKKAREAADFLLQRLHENIRPRVGLICGSGLGNLADTLHPNPKVEIDYAEIPHFPISTGMGPTG